MLSIMEAMDIDINICQATCQQQDSDLWWESRRGRITASKFGRVMSARSDKSLETLSSDITGPRVKDKYIPPACLMGTREEPNAKEAYIQYQREVNGVIVQVLDVGLCVPNWCRYIGATPDGIVITPKCQHILEIKCILDKSPIPRSIIQVAQDRGSGFYCSVNSDGELQLKKRHQYYYQVLGEMATTGLWTADFVIYHPRTKEIKVLRVLFDPDEWSRVKDKLDNFKSKYLADK